MEGARIQTNIMKTHNQSMVLAGICIGALCLSSAHAQSSKFYLSGDAGGVLTGDTRVKEFFGPVDANTKVRLDPGVRFGVVGGYQLTDWFSVEGESGVMANNIDSISGADIRGDATLANIPFLVNARFQIPHGRCPIIPFIGGGAGGAASVLSLEHHMDLNGVRLHGSDATGVLAWQAFAGLHYALNDQMSVGVEYHYFATTGPTWDASASGTESDHVRFLGVQSHAITASFNYSF